MSQFLQVDKRYKAILNRAGFIQYKEREGKREMNQIVSQTELNHVSILSWIARVDSFFFIFFKVFLLIADL